MRVVETVMGIPMSIDLRADIVDTGDTGDHRMMLNDAFGELRNADATFSPFRPDSELSRLNRGELTRETVGDDFRSVLETAERFSTVSGGTFTLHDSNGALDLNGIVKGWAAQKAGELLVSRGLRHFCINAGGDVVAAGHPEPGRPWMVGVRSPESAETMLAVFALSDRSIATSGAYERGSHIVDGRTGRVASGLASVSVIAADLTTADVLATTVFAMGEDGIGWATERYDCGVLAVTDSGTLIDGGDARRWLANAPTR
jgi:thiamine biosynthesis lipoprotein